ncbi:MAG: UPF0182 family protein [Syntrophomonadaceae bacterium]|nr:UPF0182 family protein [Syntrophomonadaceae bacterium]MDD3897859.1 UPF0182 family protein [Syntrophomonadaceae bacterium]
METRSNRGTINLVIFLVLLGILSFLAGLYGDWLWFSSVGFSNVFKILLFNRVGIYLLVFLLTLLLFYFNLRLTRRYLREYERPDETDEGREIIYLNQEKSPFQGFLQGKMVRWVFLGISILAALMISSTAADNWIVVQQFINRVPMGTVDPIFSKDISFYFFNLTFYRFVYGTLMAALVLTAVVVGFVYMLNASTELIFGDWRQFTFAKSHVAILLAAIFALKAVGYKLSTYEILFSPSGLVYGATYTDVHAKLLAYKILLIVSIIVAVVILANIFIKKLNWVLFGIGAWIVVAIVMSGIYPIALQKLVVQPNEFNREKPYIQAAIKYTRQAYGLDKVQNRSFTVDYDLDIKSPNNQDTITNIRLWDWQPLTDTYKSLQELRPYYVFNDMDIDRYMIDGKYRQVMISARELDQNNLNAEAKTWINQKLMYTHGYGTVVTPVNEVAQEGFPNFFIKDIPPRFSTSLEVTRPEIYFGERTDSYVIVNTKQKEYDYPAGDTNVYSNYQGKDGIKINSFARRLLLSWVLKDYKIILSSDISNNSQVLMNRNIIDRTKKIAPYLSFDGDPYIVIDDKGKLFWILDTYTSSSRYPYAQPFDQYGNNYLRNSVKITCDAYTGELKFYVADPSDPIIKTYSNIFPGMYQPLANMPDSLRAHVRYPVDLYQVQAQIFKTFHMNDPYVFYNKEDPWLIPKEMVNNEQTIMEPYYIIMRLPESDKSEYILMLPFTPKSRPNMIAWMCARMDGDEYGKLLVYNFPKKETVYGPEQVESRINQNTDISQQLSLWNQQGSRVYRGNLLVIPMDDSILYVEPLYLQAENSRIPELKRVIAGFGDEIVMETSLDKALTRLFDKRPGQTPTVVDSKTSDAADTGSDNTAKLAKLAREYYDQANQRLREGDWAGYGDNITKLNDIIRRLEKSAGQ